MMAGVNSPARPWFRLTTWIPGWMSPPPLKAWLANVTRLMLMVFAKSNTYRALHSMYEELGLFGTGSSIVLPRFQGRYSSSRTLSAGEYAIATDNQGRVDTLYREFQITVAQMVREFGRTSAAPQCKTYLTAARWNSG